MEGLSLRSGGFLVIAAAFTVFLAYPPEIHADGCGCPSYWTPFRQHCYRFFTKNITWFDAELYCRQFSVPCGQDDTQENVLGHLTSVHSQEEMDFLSGLYDSARTKRSTSWVWIGLHDRETERTFNWTDGSQLDYTYWRPGEPQLGQSQDCVVFRRQNDFGWADAGCAWYAVESFVCKMPKW